MFARRVATFLLVSVTLLAACKRRPAVPPDVVARVNDRMLTLADFKRYLVRNAGTDLSQLNAEVASAILDQFVEEIIVSEYAASHGVEVPAEKIAAAVRTEAGATVVEKRDEMRREKLLTDLSAKLPEPSQTEVQDFYNTHQGDFRSDEEVRVRQILVHDEALAKEIVQQLRNGVSFADLSDRHSRAPNAKRGGEIGFVSRGELPKMFEDQIFRLQPGQVSDVIRTDTSFHIFQVDERRPAGLLDLQAAAPLIVARLKEEGIRDQLNSLVTKSRGEMQIAILTRRLPFRYSGTLPKSEAE
jgi:parvulin-like peptidyl-prolyl isomerase